MSLSKSNYLYEDTLPSDNVVRLKSAILYQLYNKNISCEEHSDYIKTELIDFYPREDGCSVVSNTILNLTFGKEFKFKKITSSTTPERISSIAEKIVTKSLNVTLNDFLKDRPVKD